jgi:hypothetical protein
MDVGSTFGKKETNKVSTPVMKKTKELASSKSAKDLLVKKPGSDKIEQGKKASDKVEKSSSDKVGGSKK